MKKIKAFIFRLFIIGFLFSIILSVYLDSMVRNEFNQQAWEIPAKIFARPLSFSLGKKLSIKELKLELDLLGYRSVIKAINPGEYEQYGSTFVIKVRAFQFWDGKQPEQVLEVTIKNNEIVELKDFASQKMVNFLRLDPLSLGSINAANLEDRQLITLQQLPKYFTAALLNTEDRNFYNHWGLSPRGIARAIWSNLSNKELRQGGSTLTQQLMKNHFLSNERTLWRKFREAIMAVLTEVHYDKNIILEAYVNEVYLGQDRATGIYGFSRASEFYFDQPLQKINLSQVALLIGIVKGPSYYNPRNQPQRAKQRRDLVLSQMYVNGLISEKEHKRAVSKTLQVVAKPKARNSRIAVFISYIKRELGQEYSLSELNSKGLRLFTSLDPLLQKKSEQTLSNQIKQIEKRHKKQVNKLQGAIIVSDIQSGDILAMVGDRNPNYFGFNRAIDAYRQTGSVIKPFVYLTALQQSEKFNLISPLEDKSFSLKGNDGSVWTPKNYDHKTHGMVELQQGLINSYNLTTARLALSVGINNVVNSIIDAGFERELPAYPSIALGAKEMSPLEVLRLYQTIANDGVGVRATGLIAVQDHQGKLLQRYRRKAVSRLDPQAVFLLKYLLTQVTANGTAKSIGKYFTKKDYAGKTGTTNDLRDSWYVGFGGEKVSVVWLGRDDNKPTGLTGASGALMVWRDLFSKLNEPSVDFTLPEGIVWGYKKQGFFASFGSCKKKPLIPFYDQRLPPNYKICD